MDPAGIVETVLAGVTVDAERALGVLLAADVGDDDLEALRAATAFLQVLACRFDDALDTALLLGHDATPSPLAKAARDLAVAACAGTIVVDPGGVGVDGVYGPLTAMLETEAALSSGLIATASEIAVRAVGDGRLTTGADAWSAVALARAQCFEGRFADADAVVDRVLSCSSLAGWPQMSSLALGARVFVDAHLGRGDAVTEGVAELRRRHPDPVCGSYVVGGAFVLAAFGAGVLGRLPEAAGLLLHAGGGDLLANLQIVDRLYGYELLVEEALARDDLPEARRWSDHAAGLPVLGHPMASAALARLRARVAAATDDREGAMQASAHAGVLAALAGSDLEVMRARILESSARAGGEERDRGIAGLEEAARRAAVGGTAALRDWAQRELRAHGRRLRNVPGVGWESLSPTQRTVARLAASGLRNREIAATLWVSDRTVEGHVAAVLEALGTTNRVGIGRELGGHDVDPVFGEGLTPRQREVAALVARGRSNADISAELAISEKTVEKHLAGLFDRLGVRTRAAVAARVRGATGEPSPPH